MAYRADETPHAHLARVAALLQHELETCRAHVQHLCDTLADELRNVSRLEGQARAYVEARDSLAPPEGARVWSMPGFQDGDNGDSAAMAQTSPPEPPPFAGGNGRIRRWFRRALCECYWGWRRRQRIVRRWFGW